MGWFHFLIFVFILAQGSESQLEDNQIFVPKCCPALQGLKSSSFECISLELSEEEIGEKFPLNLGIKNETISITLQESGYLNCSGDESLTSFLNGAVGNQTESIPTKTQFFFEETSQQLFVLKTETLYQENFCIDRMFSESLLFEGTTSLVCRKDPQQECLNETCVSLCCNTGHHFDIPSASCVVSEEVGQSLPVVVDESEMKFFGFPEGCSQQGFLIDETVAMSNLGVLTYKNISYNYNQYCYARFDSISDDWKLALTCASESDNELLEIKQIGQTIIKSLFVISMFFLVASFVDIFNKQRGKLFGAMTLCMIAMLFMFYLMYTLIIFLGSGFVISQPTLCRIQGYLIQYFYISAMCWLSSMCFDIWSTFRQMRNRALDNLSRGWRHPKFKWYALWSWGVPYVVLMVTLTMEYLPKELTEGYIKPEVGESRCFLGLDGTLFYFHIINLPILLVNLCLFVSSSWNLWCGLWASSGIVQAPQTQRRAKFVAKMFWVMGLTWISEVISWILGRYLDETVMVIKVSLFFDCVNALQGFSLFCALFFDEETVRKMNKKIFPKRKMSSTVSTSQKTSTVTAVTLTELAATSETPKKLRAIASEDKSDANLFHSTPLQENKENATKKIVSMSSDDELNDSTFEVKHFVEEQQMPKSGIQKKNFFSKKRGSYKF